MNRTRDLTFSGSPKPVTALRQRMGSKHLLVVDDDRGVVHFIDRVLSEAGYKTQTASSGDEALALIERGARFDLIVSDVRMLAMSGPEFVARARQTLPYVKVLYVTAFNNELFSERHALWANEAFLDKPFSAKGLLESVSLLLFGTLTPEPSAPNRPH